MNLPILHSINGQDKPLTTKKFLPLGNLRKYSEYDNHEFVISINDEVSGLRAFIAIHSTRLGPAHGGTRMQVYKNESDAIKDVLKLSRAMSYKSAIAGLPYGGAKGVIMLRGDHDNREEILRAYANKIEKLHGLFRTGTDAGVTDSDVEYMARYSNFFLGLTNDKKEELTTSKTAAQGVFIAIKTSLNYRYGTDSLKDRVVGIKGIGKLGQELLALLYADGARVYIADSDARRVETVGLLYPKNVSVVDPNIIHSLEMDVYAPCALGNEFKPAIIKELKSQIIAGGANNQLPDYAAGDLLFKRNILYAPDYIVNAGGLIFVSEDLEQGEFMKKRVFERLERIPVTLERVFETSAREKIPTHRIADRLALEHIQGIA